MKLNLGCWVHPLEGYVNVDILPWTKDVVICDLNVFPWPWADESVDHIRADAILEHLRPHKRDVVQEMARVLKPGGTADIMVPCATHMWALGPLQHVHAFQYNSFDGGYDQPWFECLDVRLYLSDPLGKSPIAVHYRGLLRKKILRMLVRFGFVYALRFQLRKRECVGNLAR